ncbi:MAG TPA: hypothetical protein VI363_05795 [Burkholderiales bacterium]
MKKFAILLSAGVLALASAAAQAQTRMFVRGTITSLDGNVLSVKSRDGKDLKVNLAPNFGVRYAKAVTMADIKPGDFVGPASKKRADGTLEAISLQVFTPDRRGQVPEGHMPWDLEPGSLMTNAIVGGMVKTSNGRELTLEYKGGSQKVFVPEGIPIFTALPGDRSMLVPGAYVVIGAQVAPDGTLSAAGGTVSKDGVKPAN